MSLKNCLGMKLYLKTIIVIELQSMSFGNTSFYNDKDNRTIVYFCKKNLRFAQL